MTYEPLDYWTKRTRKLLDTDDPVLVHRDRSLQVDGATLNWLRLQLQQLDRHPRLLEVGCGFGRWAALLQGCYADYIGVDIVQARIDAAQAAYGDLALDFICVAPDGKWDIQAPDDVIPVDVVMSITVLQHVNFDTAVRLLQSMARHLKPGGLALLAEWRLFDEPRAAIEAREHELHMIPKSIPALREAVPEFTWEGRQGRFVLRKAAA